MHWLRIQRAWKKCFHIGLVWRCFSASFFFPTPSANFKPCKSKPRVQRLWIFLHTGIGLILLYLKIQYLFNCLFGNGSWMRKLGRHWYFLNLVFLPRKCPAKDKFRPDQDMTSCKAYPVPFCAATWTGIVRRCQWKVHNCSKRSFDTKTWPTAPGSTRDKFCPILSGFPSAQ